MQNKNPQIVAVPLTKQITAAVIGNALEWYDFIVYGFLTVIISRLFFPAHSEYASLLLTTAPAATSSGARTAPRQGRDSSATSDRGPAAHSHLFASARRTSSRTSAGSCSSAPTTAPTDLSSGARTAPRGGRGSSATSGRAAAAQVPISSQASAGRSSSAPTTAPTDLSSGARTAPRRGRGSSVT